ncbi:MAG: sulfurtransferase, partial [Deltaproteobacteria bacterium]
MNQKRIIEHPILDIPEKEEYITFTFNGKKLKGKKGETIASALIANGIQIFGHHHKDNSPQGIFCANGQCAQCTVIANGVAVKSCMTPLEEGMIVESLEGRPSLPEDNEKIELGEVKTIETDVLIIGGGPAGLSAAIELSKYDINIILVDDKTKLGGKLVLQTHKFFGSVADSFAGTRGYKIGEMLEKQIKDASNVRVWLQSTAVAVFSDKVIGIRRKDDYILVKPKKLLVATGAREKMLAFPGNTLPGVYGAGAFQTLVNRDLVKSSERIFIVGGGNVGLIAGYHAIQAGIKVVGLAEALPKCGGYKVHEDKLRRLGVPIYTRHTVLQAHGKDHVEAVTIVQIDKNFKPIKGTEKTFPVDTILIAVGLDPVNEFYNKAKEYGLDVWAAGDAKEIAEASAAMFSGRMAALEIAKSLGVTDEEIPDEWRKKEQILKSHPGPIHERKVSLRTEGVFPVLHCYQEIPCNPCTSICPKRLIVIKEGGLLGIPVYEERDDAKCIGCAQCVAICPGLAITLVDFRNNSELPTVTFPVELQNERIKEGAKVTVISEDGNELGEYPVKRVRILKRFPKTKLVDIELPKNIAHIAASIKPFVEEKVEPIDLYQEYIPDEAIICRCERVTAGEIRALIRKGIRDMNEIKALTRAGMGACGAKTCSSLIERLFREEGIKDYVPFTKRPLFVETPLKYFVTKEEE